MSFEGKVALITGGSRGIGKAVALEFARRGADIAFNYLRGHERAAETQREIEALGVRCLRVRAHLGDAEKIKDLFAKVAKAYPALDILVNNAASGVQRSAAELEEKHWDWTMNINARAPWLCSIQASRLMTNGGSIVNMTSLGAQKVLPDYFSVGTSKAALETITRYLAVELAPKGISVNAVSGGVVDTAAGRRHAECGRADAARADGDRRGHRPGGGVPVQRRGLDDSRPGPGGGRRSDPQGVTAGSTSTTENASDSPDRTAPASACASLT